MLSDLLNELEKNQVILVAVSKTKPVEDIMKLYKQGHKILGENRVQELQSKYELLPKDIQWHLIGHLQSNKVKIIAPFISMIHSVDSLKLLIEINKQAQKNDRVIPVLLQFHIARESSKFGLDLADAKLLLDSEAYQNMDNIQIAGVMGMASFTDNKAIVKREFSNLKYIFDALKTAYFSKDPAFKEVSMGMSGDYKIAIEEGSTMVRIGSLIFGARG